MEIRTEPKDDGSRSSSDIVKIVWQGERIAKLVFASGKVVDFTRPDALTGQETAPGAEAESKGA